MACLLKQVLLIRIASKPTKHRLNPMLKELQFQVMVLEQRHLLKAMLARRLLDKRSQLLALDLLLMVPVLLHLDRRTLPGGLSVKRPQRQC